ncbi:hypothetical protein AX15_006400 [Amanita polypyramis BW_CC]|nr:hypothetical protein AX15_006400 [Amanita polypyramis BW_CC]
MPTKLKQALTVVIPKLNKPDYKKAKAWRPIALLPCISKLLMGVIAKCLQYEARAYNLLHPNQYGGQLQGLFTTVLVVDIAQFFPSIKQHIAIEIYRRQGFAEHLIQFLGSYLSDRTTNYSLGTTTSDLFNMNTGIPQGLLKALHPWDRQSQKLLLSFINDTRFVISSCSLEANIVYLQTQYPRWKASFQHLGLKLEDDKMELFHV